MISYVIGDLLQSDAQALVNTVNTEGIMGKGLALQFKKAFPNNYKIYLAACKENLFSIGDLIITNEESLLYGKKTIINFPTKTNWRKSSEYSYIQIGLKKLSQIINEQGIKSIAIPPLGSGHGGLNWEKVKKIMEENLADTHADILIYEPNNAIKEALKKERVKLTPARAMLLAVLFEFIKNGEFISEFAAEKTAYFLQRFGANDIFNLDFKQYFYGPYSGKVKYVLNYLNGSYITGYISMDKKPFEELGIIMDSEDDVLNYLKNESEPVYLQIVEKTKEFLSGFYSSFGLELLSTVDFIARENHLKKIDDIKANLDGWNNRKRTLFSNSKFIEQAINRLEEYNLID